MNLGVMQVVRLKGMVTPEAVAAVTGSSVDEALAELQQLAADGDADEKNGRFRMSREGRERLDAALTEERAGIDGAAVTVLYEEFVPLNSEFKSLVHTWQLRDGEPNDHADAAYDEAVLENLSELHTRFAPLVERAASITPRLGTYPQRFVVALEQVRGGDHSMFLHPMKDSYHQVWFELHEDLIGLAGLSRLEEAAEGRAD